MTTETLCQVPSCDRPSSGWFVCKRCSDILCDETLAEISWLLDDLDLVIAKQVKYGSRIGGKSAETPIPVNMTASDAKARLVNELTTSVRIIAESNQIAPDCHDAKTAADWLIYHISKIRLHDAGGQVVEDISREFANCMWIVDRPRSKQYLGDCKDHERADDLPECPGEIWGYDNKPEVVCDTCGSWWPREELQEWLLGQFDGRVMTASEIAHMSVYLGLDVDREQVRKRINQWHRRGLIHALDVIADGKIREGFRFSEVKLLLARIDSEKRMAG